MDPEKETADLFEDADDEVEEKDLDALLSDELDDPSDDLEDYPDDAPKKKTGLIIGVLLVVILLLGAGIGYYYYNSTRDKSGDNAYASGLTSNYQTYSQAQQDYFMALNNVFSTLESSSTPAAEVDKHVFTDEEVQQIKGAGQMFVSRANTALDAMIAAKAPAGKGGVQKDVAAAAKVMKEKIVPVTVQAQDEIKAGQTVADFKANSEKIFNDKNDDTQKAYKDLEAALKKAGVKINDAGSGDSNGNTSGN